MSYNDLLQFLKAKKDIPAEKYDASYELVPKTLEYLRKQDLMQLGVKDLEMLYFMTIHTGKSSFKHKKKKVEESHLAEEDKMKLIEFIDTIQYKVNEKDYIRIRAGYKGIFGAAIFKFSKTSDEDARQFLGMCIEIFSEKDVNKMFAIVENSLKNSLKGIGIATVSQILHCLKPTIFPVLNNAVREMGKLHLQLENPKDITRYVANTKIIEKFRDENLPFKNYIILDQALYELNKNKDIIEKNEPNTVIASTNQLNMSRNQILYGPPGTGKTYKLIKEYFPLFTDPKTGEKRYVFITFHQAYGYEEFIEGIRPIIDEQTQQVRYEIKPGIFKIMVQKAIHNPEQNFAIFIDEINRGNIAKIFGELITLLEDDKRLGSLHELQVKLPYSNENFSIPSNLYIIGTMNTADRSIALIDIALRRRFIFIPVYPDYNAEGLQYKNLLQRLNEKILKENGLDYQIGHSYFLKRDGDFDLAEVMNKKIIPLLQEYFYNEPETIEEILNYCGILVKEEERALGRIVFKSYSPSHE